jgi:hypothetical protein
VDPVSPLRQAPAREVRKPRGEVEPIRLEMVRRPADEAFEQVAARAADVEERAVAVDGISDRPPRRFPACLVAAEARLGARVLSGQVGAFEDLGHPGEPAIVLDFATLERRGEFVGPPLPFRSAHAHLRLAPAIPFLVP